MLVGSILKKSYLLIHYYKLIVNTIILSSGSAVAGKSYTLSCLIQGTNRATAFRWEGPDGSISTASMNPVVNSSGLVSMLIFSPLLTSHGRNYTCEAYGRETTSLIVTCTIGIKLIV